MKWALCILLLVVGVYAWSGFAAKGKQVETLTAEYNHALEQGDSDRKAEAIEEQINGIKSERIFSGILLTVVSAVVAGLLIVTYVLPFFAHRVTHALFDSGEMVEKDLLRDAHSLLARGEYAEAIEAFRKAALEDPLNRLPWVEISKVYREKLQDPAAALDVLRQALEGQEWAVDDAAFLMFRIAELYDEDAGDRVTARGILQQVVEAFPQTRHSANATHKLREWDVQDVENARKAEEEAFIARNSAHPGDSGGQAD